MIESKVDFMRDVEMILSDKITVHDMNTVMKAIADVLEGYEMRTTRTWAEDQDDLLTCYVSAMTVEGRSQKTIDRYCYLIRRLMEYVKVPTRRVTVYPSGLILQLKKTAGFLTRRWKDTERFTALISIGCSVKA